VVLSHGARIVLAGTAMIDGTILAFDDQTLGELWRIKIGSGFNAPPFGLQPYDDVALAPVNADLVRNVPRARDASIRIKNYKSPNPDSLKLDVQDRRYDRL
jgi:hypothetical protein